MEVALSSVTVRVVFAPADDIVAKYADLLVKYALHGGDGVAKGEVVQAVLPDIAKPLYNHLQRAILERHAFPIMKLYATDSEKAFFDAANDDQLVFFPEAYKRAEADLIDHQVSIIAETNPQELKDVDPQRIFRAADARRKMREWLFTKENQGKFTWTLALWGTEAMAKEAQMTIEEYWDQIIHACYLDATDPIEEWRRIQREQERIKSALDALQIEKVHVEGERIDLWVQIGKRRKWLGGSGRNIPSYELFVSPDWRGTQGRITFSEPLYRYGNILRGITLEFKDGLVVNAEAKEGQSVLDSMLARENAKKIGEYSLTDKRFSRITKFMANTLFDENMGGAYGNMHIAVGKAYKDSFDGDIAATTDAEWAAMGYNDSPEHTDIITTEDRTVTAYLPDGSTKVIFKEGMFTV